MPKRETGLFVVVVVVVLERLSAHSRSNGLPFLAVFRVSRFFGRSTLDVDHSKNASDGDISEVARAQARSLFVFEKRRGYVRDYGHGCECDCALRVARTRNAMLAAQSLLEEWPLRDGPRPPGVGGNVRRVGDATDR